MSADKLVDSTQLDSDLTSVANAIRAKSGGSSQLAFPAGFVSEIQAIPSGGGLPEGISAFTTGTFTVASAVNGYTITHGLGAIPKVFVVYVEGVPWRYRYNTYTLYFAAVTTDGSATFKGNVRENSTNNKGRSLGGNRNNSGDVSTTTVTIWKSANEQGQFKPTQFTDAENTETEPLTYRWYAFA